MSSETVEAEAEAGISSKSRREKEDSGSIKERWNARGSGIKSDVASILFT